MGIMVKINDILVKPAGPDCNLGCTYCFYSEKIDMFSETRKHRMDEAILKTLIRSFLMESGPNPYMGWQGGEPTLMGLDFFRKAVEYQKRFAPEKTVMNGLQTNGVLLDRKWARFLRENNFLVGLSLDGPQHIHDKYRKTISGNGTWEKVRYNAEMLIRSGVNVNAMTVVNDYSVNYPDEIYEHLKETGFRHMQYIPCVEKGNDGRLVDFSVPSESYGEFLCSIFDRWIDDFDNDIPSVSVRLFDVLFYYYVGKAIPECTYQRECGQYLVVEHNGNVYPCDFFVSQENCLGNIMETSVGSLINSEKQRTFGAGKALLPEECSECKWLNICHGGCMKDRVSVDGSVPVNHLCDGYKIFFEHADEKFKENARVWKEKRSKEVKKMVRLNEVMRTASPGRNDPCPCGSGRKFKKCCGSQG